jgi:hypothetical protein
MKTNGITRCEVLIRAIAEVGGDGYEFTLQDLVVAAWKLCPEYFGLRRYPQLPCSNKVIVTLLGPTGPLRQGIIRRIGPNLYQVESSWLRQRRKSAKS